MCYVLFDKKLEECGQNLEDIAKLLDSESVDKYFFISWLSRHAGREDYKWLRDVFKLDSIKSMFSHSSRWCEAIDAVEKEDVAKLLYMLHRETDGDKMQKLISHKCSFCTDVDDVKKIEEV